MFCVKFNLGMGQFNNVNLFLVSLAIYLFHVKREVSGGVAIGLSLLLKVLPVLFLPYFFITRQWKALFATVVVGSVGMLAGMIFFKKELTAYFLTATLFGTLRSWPLDYYNQALSGFLGRMLGTGEFSAFLKISLTIILILLTLYVLWRSRKSKKTAY